MSERVQPAITIRAADRADVPDVIALITGGAVQGGVAEAASGGAVTAEHYAAYDEIVADPKSTVYVAELDGTVVATAQLTYLRHLANHGALVAQVESVHTTARLRGHGIGRALMEFLIEQAGDAGAARMQLTSNAQRVEAHRFYERLGFAASHVGMKLPLPPAEG